MAQYQPSYVDTSGFSKAIEDAAYRSQLIAMRQQESMNRAIDNQFKTYSGKLRKQDMAKFDAYFGDYSEALKVKQRYNRVGGRSSEMMAASALAEEKKRVMLDFVERSAKLGQVQVGLGKLYKDGGKLLNKSKYNEVYNNLSSYDADELDSLYGGVDKIPMDFELRKEDIDSNKYFGTIRNFSKIGNLSSSTIKQPKIDPNTNQQITRPYSLGEFGQIDVPLVEVKVGLTPAEARNAVWASSVPGTKFQDAPDVYLKDVTEGLQSENPSIQQQSRDILNRTMATYGIKDPSQVTGVDILAQSILDQSQQSIEIEDWSKVKALEGMERGRKADQLREKRLAAIGAAKSGSSIKQTQAIVNLMKTMVESGLVYDQDAMEFANNILAEFGLSVSKDMAEEYKKMQGTGKVGIAQGVAEEAIKTPRPRAVPKP